MRGDGREMVEDMKTVMTRKAEKSGFRFVGTNFGFGNFKNIFTVQRTSDENRGRADGEDLSSGRGVDADFPFHDVSSLAGFSS